MAVVLYLCKVSTFSMNSIPFSMHYVLVCVEAVNKLAGGQGF